MLWKKLLSLVLLFLLLSQSLFGEWVYSDAQVNEMIEENNKTDRLLKENQITLQSNSLIIASYENSNKIISMNSESIMQSYERIITTHSNRITELETSLDQEKKDSFWINLKKFFGGFIWGALGGLFGGFYLGTL